MEERGEVLCFDRKKKSGKLVKAIEMEVGWKATPARRLQVAPPGQPSISQRHPSFAYLSTGRYISTKIANFSLAKSSRSSASSPEFIVAGCLEVIAPITRLDRDALSSCCRLLA